MRNFGVDLVHHHMNHWQPENGQGPRGGFGSTFDTRPILRAMRGAFTAEITSTCDYDTSSPNFNTAGRESHSALEDRLGSGR